AGRLHEVAGVLGRMEHRLAELEERCSRALEPLANSPQLRMFGSGFDRFSRQVVEESTRLSGGEETRCLLDTFGAAARHLDRFQSDFNLAMHRLSATLSESTISRKTRGLYTQLHAIFKKVADVQDALKKVQAAVLPVSPRLGDSADGHVTFEAYCEGVLRDPERLSSLTGSEDGLFSRVVEDYSRLSARRLLEAVRDQPQVNPDELRRGLQEWLGTWLLVLDDYLVTLSREMEADPEAARPVRPVVDQVAAQLEATLRVLGLERMRIRVNEDVFDARGHDLARRLGPGQTICKVERNGFLWGGQILRKASVLVG
ncbi:MAG: hypothetical protein AB1758_22500, partial [Candidatus Eremiobacterota bacterium]